MLQNNGLATDEGRKIYSMMGECLMELCDITLKHPFGSDDPLFRSLENLAGKLAVTQDEITNIVGALARKSVDN